MDNIEIASIFSKIAEFLEFKDENRFKIRAYRTAARNITGLSRQLADVYGEDPGSLENIPGIGKDLKTKIIEMIKTGGLKYYDELVKEFPPGFVDMLNISGLGPRKLKKLNKELGIENVDDLEKACVSGKVAIMEGMGEKTQKKLLEEIPHFRQKAGRMLLPEADRLAARLVDYLSKNKSISRIETAGSLRRGRETVGDIDILAVAKNTGKAMDYFADYPGKEKIIAKGPTKTSILLKGGPQVDMRIVGREAFGAALVYFTGSKEHNIKIRNIAKSMGRKVNEYGVFSVDKNGRERFIAGRTEKDVYKALGLSYIPPELRESRGEIEAAGEHVLPGKLIEMGHIKGDLHIHTNATDGRASIEEIISAAEMRSYEYVAVTDHSKLIKISGGMNEKELLAHADKIRKAAKKHKNIKVLAGVEVDILEDGTLDLEDYALKELDIVVAAVHSKFSFEKGKQTERILKALDNKYVNILAHPSGRLITRRRPLDLDMDRIFKKASETGCVLEINTHGERIDLNDVNARRAVELGAKLAINTDAHEVNQMDLIVYGVITARRGWVERSSVVNTYTYEKLKKTLKK